MAQSPLIVLLLLAALPLLARADDRANAFGMTVDGLMTDTERPAGDRAEKHGARFGLEFSHTIWPRFDVFAAAGVHRLRLENAGTATDLNFIDWRVGARQYFVARSIQAWSPFIDAAVGEGRMRETDSTVGGNRRYAGWNASVGVAKLVSDNADLRLGIGYQRWRTDVKKNDHTDELTSADFRLAVMVRY